MDGLDLTVKACGGGKRSGQCQRAQTNKGEYATEPDSGKSSTYKRNEVEVNVRW